MHRFSFKKGLKFLRGQFAWRIVRRLPDKRIQWELRISVNMVTEFSNVDISCSTR